VLTETVIRILLVVLGALIGVAAASYISRVKLRRLAPVAISQLRDAAQLSCLVYAKPEAAASAPAMESASKFASEVVASGLRLKDWQVGAKLIQETQTAIAQVASATPDSTPEATGSLREKAIALREWANAAKMDRA